MPCTLSCADSGASLPPISVFTQPGCTSNTLMRCAFKSKDRLRITALSAALLERYNNALPLLLSAYEYGVHAKVS